MKQKKQEKKKMYECSNTINEDTGCCICKDKKKEYRSLRTEKNVEDIQEIRNNMMEKYTNKYLNPLLYM